MTNQELFELFLGYIEKKDKTINNYSNCLAGIVTDKINKSIERIGSLYDIMEVNKLEYLLDSVLKEKDFAEQNEKGKNMYSAAFNLIYKVCKTYNRI